MNRHLNIRRSQSDQLDSRAAFSLLEVVVGMAVVALILVPTAVLMNEVLRGEATQKIRDEMIHLAAGKQNELAHLTRVQFRNRSQNGNFASVGYPRIRYSAVGSQAVSSGGIPNRLMIIRTQAWDDANGNRRIDRGETSVDLWTSVARATR